MADENAAPGGVAAVDRALSLLKAFQKDDGPLSLSEIAERTQLYKSTTLRLLASLLHAQLVHQCQDGRYVLGGEVARLHEVFMASFSLERVVVPVLKKLSKQTGESAAYHVIRGDIRLCLFRVDSPHPIRDHTRAGDVLPVDRGTGGRVLAAYGAIPSVAASAKDLRLYAQIRKDGYYSAVGDRLKDVAGISAPVFGSGGAIAGALTLTMPADRYNDAYIAQVTACAAELSGYV